MYRVPHLANQSRIGIHVPPRYRGMGIGVIVLLMAVSGMLTPVRAADQDKIDFARQIRPILSENCFACHGPDEEQRKKVKTKLRLDTKDGLFTKLDDIVPIVAKDPGHSEVFKRICSKDEDDHMPPVKTGKRLNPAQIDVIKRWIDQGAPWEQHWAFVSPQRPAIPRVKEALWPRNDIDYFVLARLEQNGSHHAPEATKTTLIRRLSLDLIGLPPTTAEIAEFIADTSPASYEKVVDRLLASPHYGERMAMAWLDGARYADTNGYQGDHERSMWRWRDWVIDAFNRNLPFDQFTIEQLAGDLLPNPSEDQRIATGFNRNHRINTEGGIIPEEWLAEVVIDRVDTTGQVWLGLTLGCARCHDHKYDPVSQRDFYRLFAFYNNVPESGLGSEVISGTPPTMKAPTPLNRQRASELENEVAQAKKRVATFEDAANDGWSLLDVRSANATSGTMLVLQSDGTVLASKPADRDVFTIQGATTQHRLAALRLQALSDQKFPANGPGMADNGNFVLSQITLAITTATGEKVIPLTGASADFSQDGYPVAHVIDGKADSGWAVMPKAGETHQVIVTFAPVDVASDAQITVKLTSSSPFARHLIGHFRLSVRATYDPALVQAKKDLAEAEKKRDDYANAIPTVMVMEEMSQPRPSFILIRGQYDHHGDPVEAGTPGSFLPMPKGAPNNRLGLARWIMDPANPLTARVAVNRFWERLFGVGLVKTSDNLGSQGEQPSHPELLDWLACEFVRQKWDMKSMLKTMVMSTTYRQSSAVDVKTAKDDPENRLLSHGPRFRMQAELIRDEALAIAGLLTYQIGGPTTRPYQPPGIWDELSDYGNLHNYQHDKGDNLYRRSLYTIWKRTTPPPDMTLLDMPSREYCLVRRARTDTPLQALTLLNDLTFVEASRVLAGLMIKNGGTSIEARLTYGFRRATARAPSLTELDVLSAGLKRHQEHFRADPESAKKLIAEGDTQPDPQQDPVDLAAYSTTAMTILNLDETITKE